LRVNTKIMFPVNNLMPFSANSSTIDFDI